MLCGNFCFCNMLTTKLLTCSLSGKQLKVICSSLWKAWRSLTVIKNIPQWLREDLLCFLLLLFASGHLEKEKRPQFPLHLVALSRNIISKQEDRLLDPFHSPLPSTVFTLPQCCPGCPVQWLVSGSRLLFAPPPPRLPVVLDRYAGVIPKKLFEANVLDKTDNHARGFN